MTQLITGSLKDQLKQLQLIDNALKSEDLYIAIGKAPTLFYFEIGNITETRRNAQEQVNQEINRVLGELGAEAQTKRDNS